MKVWLKRGLYALGALVIVLAVAAMAYREQLERLYRVNTLFEEDRIVANFSSMDRMFLSSPIARAGPVWEFGVAPQPLPETFVSTTGETNTAAFLAERTTTSPLVIRDDRIEFEEYFLGTEAEDLRISWSIAKSFLSALVGVAIGEGAIASLDDPVIKYAPSLKGSAYDGATIRNVANMASGVKFNEDYLDCNSDINRMGRELALGGSLDEFAAALAETVDEPGAAWRYVSIDAHVLGMAPRGATGRPVADYMAEKLWSKIGVEADAYYVTDAEEAAFVLGGLNIRTRDYARFGRLILNNGEWAGEAVLPAGWVSESIAPSAPDPANAKVRTRYGYQWRTPPDADDEVYRIGVYGQFPWIDRKANVVIVKTSADRLFRADDSRAQYDTFELFRAFARR